MIRRFVIRFKDNAHTSRISTRRKIVHISIGYGHQQKHGGGWHRRTASTWWTTGRRRRTGACDASSPTASSSGASRSGSGTRWELNRGSGRKPRTSGRSTTTAITSGFALLGPSLSSPAHRPSLASFSTPCVPLCACVRALSACVCEFLLRRCMRRVVGKERTGGR